MEKIRVRETTTVVEGPSTTHYEAGFSGSVPKAHADQLLASGNADRAKAEHRAPVAHGKPESEPTNGT